MIKVQQFNLSIVFTQPLLGSQPTFDVASEYIAAANGIELPDDEAATLPEALERGTTVFHKLDGKPVMWDYQVKGFLKESARTRNGKVTGGVKNLRSKVDQLVFVTPRTISLALPVGGVIDHLERPLRAETAQGPRVALARSERLPAGTSLICTIDLLSGDVSRAVLVDLLDYGRYKGMGQWRNGSYGQFTYTLEEV